MRQRSGFVVGNVNQVPGTVKARGIEERALVLQVNDSAREPQADARRRSGARVPA